MKRLLPLTPEQLAGAEERLRHPRPGSRIEAAKQFGIDLTLVICNLRLSPEERVREMSALVDEADQLRGIARNKRA